MADVELTQKMIPFIACEISLVVGVNVFDLVCWVQIDSIEKPINNSVGSGYVSHCRTSSLSS